MNVPILYGGSVNAVSTKQILQLAGVDGLLVGRSSLIATEFAGMVNDAAAIVKESQRA